MLQYSGDDRWIMKNRRGGDASLEPFCVLIVEPHEDMLELCRYCLEADGHRVATARDADDGFACAQRELPDLFIIELALPRRDGLALIDQLRCDPLTQDIPVIVLTSMTDHVTLAAAQAHGAIAALAKPAMPEEIQHAVNEIHVHADPMQLVKRQLRRKLIAVSHAARRFGASSELRQHLARFIDSLQQAVLLMNDAGRVPSASGAAEVLAEYAERLTPAHAFFDAIVAGKRVSGAGWGRARSTEHWSGCAEFVHRDGHTARTRAVYMAAGAGGLHVAACAPASGAQLRW